MSRRNIQYSESSSNYFFHIKDNVHRFIRFAYCMKTKKCPFEFLPDLCCKYYFSRQESSIPLKKSF